MESLADLDQVLKLVMLPGDEIVRSGDPIYSGKRWEHHGVTIYGLWYAWDKPDGGVPGKLLLVIPGSYLARMAAEAVWSLSRQLIFDWGFKTTRTDLALDDYTKAVAPAMVLEAGEQGNFGLFRNKPRYSGNAQTGGLTVIYGSRASDKELRVYDKAVESEGSVDSVRWELELRDEVAHQHLLQFASCPWDELPYHFVAEAVMGCIEFCDRTDRSQRLDRCMPLEWWSKMREAIKGVRLPVARVKPTLEKTMSWISSQIAPSLVVLHKVLGVARFNEYLSQIVASASRNLSPRNLARVKVAMHEGYPNNYINSCFSST